MDKYFLPIKAEITGDFAPGGTTRQNHSTATQYLSGRSMRGAFASIWPRGELGNDEFLNKFCRGDIWFSGLFPVEDRVSRYPYRTPLSAYTCKYGGLKHGIYDLCDDSSQTPNCCSVCKAELSRVSSPFLLRMDDGNIVPFSLKQEVRINNNIANRAKRTLKDGVFSTDIIKKNQHMIGWLYGEKAQLNEFVEKISTAPDNSFNLSFGRRKKAGSPLKCTFDGLIHFAATNTHLKVQRRIVVMLQTPAIFLDKWFNPCFPDKSFFFSDSVSDLVEMNLEKTFTSSCEINGWSGVHGLPCAPMKSFDSGSVFSFEIKTEDPNEIESIYDDVFRIYDEGIGEMRNVGYGRVEIAYPTTDGGADV
ncbi:hypothetical protein [Maridesulfovibrio sp.]|uniref:hypothetical protein n=1 Tax=Maridesulfovibrio sp. TaxID=2795000 RepID=UPI0039EF15FC